MNDGEIEALEAQYKKAVYPSHVPGGNNIVFDSNLIEKGVRKLLDEVKAQKLQIETLAKDRDAWIGHHDTVINTFTKTNNELQESNRLIEELKKTLGSALQYVEHARIGHLVNEETLETRHDETCFKCRALRVYFGPEEYEQGKRNISSSKNPPEAFVVQLCHGEKADGLYYDGDGDWTDFENACTYYSHHDMDEVLKEARQANEDKTAEAVAFTVILSRR